MKSKIVGQEEEEEEIEPVTESPALKNRMSIVVAAFFAQIAIVVYLLLKGYLL